MVNSGKKKKSPKFFFLEELKKIKETYSILTKLISNPLLFIYIYIYIYL